MENNGPLKCFFYDVGNVLVNHTNARQKFQQKIAQLTNLPIKIIDGLYEQGLGQYWHDFERGGILAGDLYRRYIQTLLVRSSLPLHVLCRSLNYDYFEEAFGNVFKRMPKSIHFMNALQNSGCKIFLVSNNNVIHYEYCLRATACQEIYDIFTNADRVVLSHKVGCRKPEERIWKIALEWSGFSPADVLVVDDKQENVDSARSLGINGHVFTNVTNLKSDLEKNFGFKF